MATAKERLEQTARHCGTELTHVDVSQKRFAKWYVSHLAVSFCGMESSQVLPAGSNVLITSIQSTTKDLAISASQTT